MPGNNNVGGISLATTDVTAEIHPQSVCAPIP